jgi:endogenous inhibitor of DNA gyrase (YacG/DUF329 family)
MPRQTMSEKPPEPDRGSSGEKSAGDARCAICNNRFARGGGFYPFCSRRCRQIDLGRWLDGSYVISRPIERNDVEEGD